MKIHLSLAAALAMAGFLQKEPIACVNGYTPLPRSKKRTGARKQQRASPKRRNALKRGQ